MDTRGLHLDQAPPLSIPMSFFATAPLAVVVAGILLFARGGPALSSNWSPITLALTHLGTLGFLSMVMMGAVYQMTPVVAGSRVRAVRLAHGVHALLVLGVAALFVGLASGAHSITFASITPLTFAVLLFVFPVGLALKRAPARTATVLGMSLAVAGFFLAALLGLWMVHGHSGMRFPGPRGLWVQVHLVVALLGWVGGLMASVSWQVIPMFFLSRLPSRIERMAILGLAWAGVGLPVLVLVLHRWGTMGWEAGVPTRLAGLGALPAVLAIWILHPWATLRSLQQRKRRRDEASLWFWRAGLAMGPVAAGASAATLLLEDPRWGLLLGWFAILGWAGTIVHGMLTRIVPFLIWFHRFAPRAGLEPVPSARSLMPEGRVRVGFALHVGAVGTGALAIATGEDLLARLAGLLLAATGGWLALSILRALRWRRAT